MRHLKTYTEQSKLCNESLRDKMKPKSVEEFPKEYKKLVDLKEYIEKNSSLEPIIEMIDGIDEAIIPRLLVKFKVESDIIFYITYNRFDDEKYYIYFWLNGYELDDKSFKTLKEVFDYIIPIINNKLKSELEELNNKKDKIEKFFKSIK